MSAFDTLNYFDRLAEKSLEKKMDPTEVAMKTQQRQQAVAAAVDNKRQVLNAVRERADNSTNQYWASFGLGANRLLEGFGTIYGLATGDMDNAARTKGAEWAQGFEDRKPISLAGRELDRRNYVEGADSELGKFGRAFWSTFSDPQLLSTLVTEQIPQLAMSGAAGRAVGMGANALGKSAETAGRAAGIAGTGTAASTQGASVASEVYDDLMAAPDELWAANEEFQARVAANEDPTQIKESIARDLAGKAGIASGGVSMATMQIPGFGIPERVLAGAGTGLRRTGQVARGFAGESLQEIAEEGSGVVIGNRAKQVLDPNQTLSEGLGEAAGIAAAAGGTLGGTLSGFGGTPREDAPPPAPERTASAPAQEAAARARETGEITELLDPERPETYNPPLAAKVLLDRAQNNELPAEVKQASEGQLNALMTGLEERLQEIESVIANPDANLQKIEAEVERRKAVLTELQAKEDPAAEELAAQLRAVEAKIAEDRQSLPEVEQAARQQKARIEQNLTSIRQLRNMSVAQGRVERKATLESLVSTVSNPESSPEVRAQSAQQVMDIAIQDPGAFDEQTAGALAQNDAFSADQQKLFRAFSAHHAALNALKDRQGVNQNILRGAPGFKGLEEYRNDAAQAVRANNMAGLEREIENLKAFQAYHQRKGVMISAASQRAANQRGNVHVVRDPNAEAGWRLEDTSPWKTPRQQSENGGWSVGPSAKQQTKTAELLNFMRGEQRALIATVAALEGMRDAMASPDRATDPLAEPREAPAAPVAAEAESVPVTAPNTPVEAERAAEPVVEPSVPQSPPNENPESGSPEAPAAGSGAAMATQTGPSVQEETRSQEDLDPNASPEEVDTSTVANGALSFLEAEAAALQTGPIPQATFKKTNLWKAYFRQVGKKSNPLVAVKDFMSVLYANGQLNRSLLERYLPKGALTSGNQLTLLTTFNNYRKWVEADIRKNIQQPRGQTKKTFKDPDFYYQDYIQFLRGPDQANSADFEIDENLVTAIALAGFTWVAENGRGNGLKTDKQLNQLLGRDEKAPITKTDEAFRGIGDFANTITADLGKRVAESLGLKANKGVQPDEQARLELALGAHALAILRQKGLVTYQTKAIPETTSATDGDSDITATLNENVPSQPVRDATAFVRVTREGDNNTLAAVERVLEASKGTSNFLHKVFSMEEAQRWPASEPGAFKQTKTKRGRPLSGKQKQALKKVSEREWEFLDDQLAVLDKFDRQTIELMAGVVPESALHLIHPAKHASVEARNDALRREIDYLMEYREALQQEGRSGFYLVPNAWSQQRSGFESNTINPQTSKFQRHLMGLKEWRVAIDPTKSDGATRELLDKFEVAVAQGMGIDVDKLGNEASIDVLGKIKEDPQVQEALNILREGGPTTPAEQQIIAEIVQGYKYRDSDGADVSVDGAGIHTLAALRDWAKLESGQPFETSIMYELDGVTNGPALTMLLLGVMNKAVGEKVGFYTESSPYTAHHEFSRAGQEDLYTSVASSIDQYLSNPEQPWAEGKKRDAKVALTNSMLKQDLLFELKRATVKTPLTAFMFGSSPKNAVKGMFLRNNYGNGIVDNYYKELEKAYGSRDTAHAQRVVQQMNVFLPGQHKLPVPRHYDEVMTSRYSLTAGQETAGASFFGWALGDGIAGALEANFAPFIDARNAITKTAGALFQRYHTARELLMKDMIEQRMAPRTKDNPLGGTLAFTEAKDGTRRPLQGLPKADLDSIDAILAPLLPRVHTAMSLASSDTGLEAGIDMMKVYRAALQKGDFEELTRTQEVGFGQTVPGLDEAGKATRTSQQTARGGKMNMEEPGAAAVILLVHALDSAIATSSYDEVAGLNIHDALGLGLKQLVAGGQALNRNTFEVLQNYSLPMEMSKALMRSFEGEAKVLSRLGEGTRAELKSALSRLEGDAGFAQMAQSAAQAMEARKQRFMDQVVRVNQYAGDGVTYVRRDTPVPEATNEAATFDEATPAQTTTPAEPQSVPQSWPQDRQLQWTHDSALVEYLQNEVGEAGKPAREVMSWLADHLKQQPKSSFRDFQLQLLRAAYQFGFQDMPVKYVPKEGQPQNQGGGHAAYRHYSDGSPGFIRINALGQDSAAVSIPTVLHELMHGITTHSTMWASNVPAADVKKLSGKDRVIYHAYTELQDLRWAAREYVEANMPDDSTWRYALGNVNELIAFGLTNPAFQKEVLEKVSVKRRTTVKTGLQALVDSLSRLFFGNVEPRNTNGMQSLLTNAAVMIEHNQAVAAQARATAQRQDAGLEFSIMESAETPPTFSSEAILEGLRNLEYSRPVNPMFGRHLSDVLSSVVSVVYQGDNVFREQMRDAAPAKPSDVFLEALKSGEAPFASRLNMLGLTDQEAFVAESLEVTMQEALNRSPDLVAEAQRLFEEVRAEVMEDMTLSAELKDLVFAPQAGETGSTYLSRFLAASLAYQPLYLKLKRTPVQEDTRRIGEQPTLGGKVKLFFERAVNALHQMFLGTQRQGNYADALQHLAKRMATLEARHLRNLAISQDSNTNLVDRLEDASSEAFKKAQGLLAKGLNAPQIRNAPWAAVRLAGRTGRLIAGNRVGDIMDALLRMRDDNFQKQQGLVAASFNEMRGETPDNAVAYAHHTLASERERTVKVLMDSTAKKISERFGRKLSREESSAVTQLVRADASALLDKFTVSDLRDLFQNDAQRQRAIEDQVRELEQMVQELSGFNKREQARILKGYKAQSKALAYFMMENQAKTASLQLNAYNIARLATTRYSGRVPESAVARLEGAIDRLTSLQALNYLARDGRTAPTLNRVWDEEVGRGVDTDGVAFTLHLYKEMQKDSQANEFFGDKSLMVKGFTSEILNPHVEVIAATASQGVELLAAGYQRVSAEPLPQDRTDPSTEARFLYYIRGKGLEEVIPGFIGYQSLRQKGWSVEDNLAEPFDPDVPRQRSQTPRGIVSSIDQAKAAEIDSIFDLSESWEPASVDRNYMVPVVNPAGQTTGYRYMMNRRSKDSLLERENRVDKVLGHMAGRAVNKRRTPLMNRDGIKALHDMAQAEFASRPNAFIEFGPRSNDPEVRERYRLLPKESRDYIQAITGTDTLMVRTDVYTLAFGYRKFSMGKALEAIFEKDEHSRKRYEKWLVSLLETVPLQWQDGGMRPLGRKAAVALLRAEHGWQEMVRIVKDIWVIKNLVTLLGNEFSNMTMLFLHGVPPHRIVTQRIAAWRATMLYRSQEAQKNGLEIELASGTLTGQARVKAQQRVTMLQDAMSRNPVHELMEAGMYQTIVEDLAQEQDPYSYQSRLSEWASKKTAWLPESVKSVGKNVLMTHDTVPYRVLNDLTIMSDFGARYVLHQHLMTKRHNAKSREESLRIVREAFVNYDVPTHRGLQYINDMGLLPFTKYYMRIQKAIMEATRSNPGRTVALMAIAAMWGGMPATILGSTLLVDPIPGTFARGAVELPGAIPELLTLRYLL